MFVLSVLMLASVSACNFWQNAEKTKTGKDLELSELTNNIPFSTKEPEIFQTEIIVTNFLDGEKSERKYFVAKKNERRLMSFDYGEKNTVSKIQTADGKSFVINQADKTFIEKTGESSTDESSELETFLTNKWLNQKAEASFQKVGTENALTKFLVKLENSEVLIFVDESLKMPVKQEFYSLSNGQKTLTLQIELKNFKLEAEDKLFELPKDLKKVE